MIKFPLAIQSGVYGYKTLQGTFVAFRSDSTGTYTFSEGSTGSTVDLGARNTYRYVNATNVYNKGKADGFTIVDVGKYFKASYTANNPMSTGTISSYTTTVDISNSIVIINISNKNSVKHDQETSARTGLMGIKNGVITDLTSQTSINAISTTFSISNYDYLIGNAPHSGTSTFTFYT